MLSMGYVKPGDTIGDPFGGVALGAIHAMLKGMDWRGVELEPKFQALGNQNIDLWRGKYGDLLRGTAVLVQGDSREFLRHVTELDGVVSSAPYASGEKGHPSLGSVNNDNWGNDGRDIAARRGVNGHYGSTHGQLGAMKEGDLDAIVTSPVYADVVDGSGEGPGARHDHVHHSGDNATKKSSDNEYGRSAGNLGGLDAVVSSAPFEDSTGNLSNNFNKWHDKQIESGNLKGNKRGKNATPQDDNYGSTSGNIGNDSADTFWQAAAVIVAQTYAALKPGAYAAWVCGDYVRGGERVYFGRQWLELCQSVGYEPVEWVIAWKREPGPTQLGLIGDDKDLSKDRVSFFRRLANKKNPDAAILNEDIVIVRKPIS